MEHIIEVSNLDGESNEWQVRCSLCPAPAATQDKEHALAWVWSHMLDTHADVITTRVEINPNTHGSDIHPTHPTNMGNPAQSVTGKAVR